MGCSTPAATTTDRLTFAADDSCQPSGKPPHVIMVLDESSFDIRAVSRRQGPGRLRVALPLVRWGDALLRRRRGRRADLVCRVQRADRTVDALVRPVRLFRHPHRRRPDRARAAAGAAALRLQHLHALPGVRRVSRRAQFPARHRRRTLHRCGRHGRPGFGARSLLLRARVAVDRTRARVGAAVSLRLSDRQSLPLDLSVPRRVDARLARPRKCAGDR